VFYETLSGKPRVSLESDKNNMYFTRRPIYTFDHISLSSSQNENVQIYRKNTFMFNIFSKIAPFMR